ncbi:unnamed protein product [Oppiella nova]|uniref:CUB domain-containing protein n=1 Tax=Oppiella nova TaxID=334625 RepID=A0A7R9M4V3_9ACAR|nr:unnamed protein product [Oppiella nova]CAG2170813.1 unnamed protein product [Oppiella nova]
MCSIKWTAINMDYGGLYESVSGTELNCHRYDIIEDIGDYIVIPMSSLNGHNLLNNVYCGQRLSAQLFPQGSGVDEPVVSQLKPFQLMVRSDSFPINPEISTPGILSQQKGFQLRYEQIPC